MWWMFLQNMRNTCIDERSLGDSVSRSASGVHKHTHSYRPSGRLADSSGSISQSLAGTLMNSTGSSHKWPLEPDWSAVSCAFYSQWSRLRYREHKLILDLSLRGRQCTTLSVSSVCWQHTQNPDSVYAHTNIPVTDHLGVINYMNLAV